MQVEVEVTLPTAEELAPLIASAREHWRAHHSHAVALAVTLDKLYLRHAHLVAEVKNFSIWCERELGVPAATARGLTRQGRVLTILADAERVDLERPETCPSTSVLRALAKVKGQRGADQMVAVWDHAQSVAGRVTAQGVKDAERDMFHPRLPAPDKETPDHEGLYPGWDDEDEDDDGELADAVGFLVEEIERIGKLAHRDRDRALAQIGEVELELASLRALIEAA